MFIIIYKNNLKLIDITSLVKKKIINLFIIKITFFNNIINKIH